MAKIGNKISYYINGLLVSSNTLRQPPDALTDAVLNEAMRIIIVMQNLPPTVTKVTAFIRITQGDTLIKEHTYQPP